ncbi:6-bladed beta-propeller [Roseivirga misakiensis]|uniref:6-bladed beta-propeller n=1 Tax=Roseivirga misakiensis TaxID=1563681 RepID=A0A1E5T090_9BACT|nr:6-bladed beta-propeller [Roseivirga misakiensis]OEK04802.1 hypothetical protein BFP71_15270 [Roseivirga misakiensis]
MRNICSLLFLLGVLSACKDSKPSAISQKDQGHRLESYQLDVESKKVRFHETIEKVELIRLEETSTSLLSRIEQVYWDQEKLIIHKGGSKDIFIFDESGNFINKINRSGNGPEEYARIDELWVNDGRLSIYTRFVGTIKQYNMKGEFISSTRIPTIFAEMGHLLPYKDDYVLETNFSTSIDSSRFKWLKLDKDFKVTGKFLPFKPVIKEEFHPHYSKTHPLTKYQNSLLLFRSHSDTIYRLTENKIEPFVHLDFGDDWHWKGHDRLTHDLFTKFETDPVPKVWQIFAQISEDRMYIKAIVGMSHWEHFLINRSDSIITRLDIRKNRDVELEMTPLRWKNDKLVVSLGSTDVREFLAELSDDQIIYKSGATLSEIEASENPALLLINFNK